VRSRARSQSRARQSSPPAEGVSDRESTVSSMVRWGKRSSVARIRFGAHALDPGRAATRRQNPAPVRPVESITLARAGGISWHQVGSAVLKRRSSGGTRFCRGSHAARFRAHGCSSLKIWVASVGRTRPGRFRKNAIERLRRYDLTRAEPRRLRRRRRGASRVKRRANTVHLAWTTGRADRAAK
jgi:hypothetical protein